LKLVHPDWEMQIRWTETKIPVLVIENEQCLFNTVDELHRQINFGDGKFVLSSNDKSLDMQNKAELILSPWSVDFSQRKITAKLLTLAKGEAVNETNYIATQQIITSVLKYVGDLSSDLPVDVLYDLDFDITELLKIVHLSINAEEMTLLEKMLQYMKVFTQLFGETCFIFNGFRNYIEQERLSEFYQNALAEKFTLLMIEAHCQEKTKEEKLYIIDSDLCQIY